MCLLCNSAIVNAQFVVINEHSCTSARAQRFLVCLNITRSQITCHLYVKTHKKVVRYRRKVCVLMIMQQRFESHQPACPPPSCRPRSGKDLRRHFRSHYRPHEPRASQGLSLSFPHSASRGRHWSKILNGV